MPHEVQPLCSHQKWPQLMLIVPLRILLRLMSDLVLTCSQWTRWEPHLIMRQADVKNCMCPGAAAVPLGGLVNSVSSMTLVSEHRALAFYQGSANTFSPTSSSLPGSSKPAGGCVFQPHSLGQARQQSFPSAQMLVTPWCFLLTCMRKSLCQLQRLLTLFLRPMGCRETARKRPKIRSKALHSDWWSFHDFYVLWIKPFALTPVSHQRKNAEAAPWEQLVGEVICKPQLRPLETPAC